MNVYSNGFGELAKRLRLKTGMTLRKFCAAHGFDISHISKIERGIMSPPADWDKLARYATCLGVQPYSDAWYSFFDYAAVASGRVPDYILRDEDLVGKLPLIFKAMGCGETIDNLIRIIREAN